ncbi:DNA polymerase/3'-5' exonuclease PolX [Patescibacteria group bacterium]|nr:DNA polymerase/3'-5' exonuclease PolX [Patescibacteria group bacterium]
MRNKEVSKILSNIARFLAMDNVAFKPQAYERAALGIESMEEDIENLYSEKKLKTIPGVGEGIAKAIEEYLKTGTIRIYEEYKKKLPIDLDALTALEGLGAKRARVLYQKLKIRSIKDLERAAKNHKIAPVFGFGEKTEKNILEGIQFLKRDKGRFLLGDIMPTVKDVFDRLASLKEVKKISLAGSLRRMKETIGDGDILIVSTFPSKVVNAFINFPGVEKVWAKGSTKASVRMKEGFDIDLRIVPAKSYGSALQYFTGSKDHNIRTRLRAMEKGLKLNEYGVFRGSKMIAGRTEKEVYSAIGLPFIPPELREDHGELNFPLPSLVEMKDIKGDLHCHSDWDGGSDSIKDMASYADSLGYEYLGIADHTKFLRIEHGLDEKQLLKQREAVKKITSFKVIQGCETNILTNGTCDIKDSVLSQLDYVIAGVHSQMKMTKEEMTDRIIRAMKNPHIDIIAHPTGRLIQRRDEFLLDFDKILRAAKETGTILEINSNPLRLDLKDVNIRRAREAGVKMVINTDSHQKEQMELMEYGVAQARRGWAEKKDIVNTYSLNKLLECL